MNADITPTHKRIILPSVDDMPPEGASFWRWLYFFVRPHRGVLLAFFIIRIARFSIIASPPFIVGWAIDAFQSGRAAADMPYFLMLLGVFLALYSGALLTITVLRHDALTQDAILRALTLYSVRHINRLPLAWHEAQGSGAKLQRVMTARAALQRLFNLNNWYMVPLLGTMAAMVGSIVMIKAPAYFILLYAAFFVHFLYAAWRAARKLDRLHGQHNSLLEGLLGRVYEFVSAVRTVKVFHMAQYIDAQARHLEGQGHDTMTDIVRVRFRRIFLMNAIGLFWTLLVTGLCIYGLYRGTLTTGAFATAFFLMHSLWIKLEDVAFIQDEFIEARNGFMRLMQTLSIKAPALDAAPVQAVPEHWRNIVFNDVSFTYADPAHPVLRHVNLAIRRGEKVALVGRSGAGKSTLIRLLTKQMWPSSGAITLDGANLKNVDSGDWLSRIGFVPQDVELFNMSIRDNILLDRAGEADEAIYRESLRRAAIDQFIDSLPERDNTLVGERGIKLSGGQRQRLGIARALVREAELIIFDEATSSLDSLSEAAIQKAVTESFADRTLVVIAHRLSTVRSVDRVFVLEDGALVEEGSFDALIAQNGVFARLWALQAQARVGEEQILT